MDKIRRYLLEVREELTKVKWPKRDEVIRLTTVVFIISTGVGAYLGALDYFFTKALEFILNN